MMSQVLPVSITTEPGRDVLPNTALWKARDSQRQPELDALRGLMLILMTLAHLPTQAQVVTNQQLGFISEAEGVHLPFSLFDRSYFWGIWRMNLASPRLSADFGHVRFDSTVIISFFLALHSRWSPQWQYIPRGPA
jgi:hypothetical protein